MSVPVPLVSMTLVFFKEVFSELPFDALANILEFEGRFKRRGDVLCKQILKTDRRRQIIMKKQMAECRRSHSFLNKGDTVTYYHFYLNLHTNDRQAFYRFVAHVDNITNVIQFCKKKSNGNGWFLSYKFICN